MNETFDRLQAGLPERYTLVRQIGRGGMSTVYLAQEQHPNRPVAVKVLDREVTVRLGRERFLREIDFVSNLTHPHIVPIFAAGEADGMLFYVMPYVEGTALSERLRRDGVLPVTTSLRIAGEVAGALEYAHRRKMLHRDIKPDNILLHDGYAMVTDFGVAKAISAAGDSSITETGITLGTAAYMAPEQAAGRTDLDGRADVYALGCVLYEMLVGEPPFGLGSPEVVLRRHITEPAQSLRTTNRSIPEIVDQAVMKSLAKKPDERFSTAAEFEETLQGIRAGLTSGSGIRVTPLLGSTFWGWRRKLAVAMAGIVTVVVLAWQLSNRGVPSALAEQPQYLDSVAVLPVENLTGDTTLDHLADAITYGAVSSLSRTAALKTSSYLSARVATEQNLPLAQLTRSLGVRLIVSPQFRQVGDRVRLDAELLDGLSGRVVTNRSWDVDPSEEQGTEQGIIRGLVDLVSTATNLAPTTGGETRIEGPAHDAYLLGKHWLGRRTPMGVKRAISHFQQAIRIDSSVAAAYEGLSNAYMLSLTYRYEIGLDGYEVAGRALAAANKAIELDPSYAAGYAARGFVISRAFGPMRSAAADFSRARELSPNTAQAVSWSGAVLAADGKKEDALAASVRGAALDPYSPGRRVGVAYAAWPLERYDLIVREARLATQLEPDILESRALEGRALVLAGRAAECLQIEFGAHDGVRALCLHALGRETEAGTIIDSIANVVRSGHQDTLFTDVVRADDLAAYYAWTGDVERALDWVERAYELSPRGIWHLILESPLFDSIRATDTGRRRLKDITGSVWDRVRQRVESTP